MKNALFSNSIISRYNMIDTKINVDYIMDQYHISEYRWTNLRHPRITSSYEIKYSQYVPVKSDPIGRFIERKLDNEADIVKFYQDLTRATNKFTYEEKIFYIFYYFKHSSEEEIARKLDRSRTGIKQIKESCILKIAFAFNEAELKKEYESH